MDKTKKALLVACIVLFGALSFVSGMLLSEILDSRQQPNPTIHNINNTMETSQDASQGGSVTFPVGTLSYVGEGRPICPFCGSTNTQQTNSGPVGNRWYYYYHCNSCGAEFSEYLENYPREWIEEYQ